MSLSEHIRLLIITKSTGGVGAYVRSVVSGLDKNRFFITVACLSEGGEKFSAELRDTYGVEAFSMAMDRYKVNPLTDLLVLLKLSRRIRLGKYQIIHAHASKPGFLARFAAIGTGIPVIYSPHNFAFHEGSNKIAAMIVVVMERLAALITTRIVAVTSHERELALSYGVGKKELYSVVLTGIDPQPFTPIAELEKAKLKESLGLPLDSLVVGSVGRLTAPKLPLEFIDVAKKIKNEMPNVRFVWVGSGPLEGVAKRYSSELGLNDTVLWLGHREDVPHIMQIFDCLLLQSKWEAFPLVLLEAFASNVPVVASDNLGVREIIKSGQNGWVVPQGNTDVAVDRVKWILDNPDEIKSVKQYARTQLDSEYNRGEMLSSLEKIYLKCACL